MYDLVITFAYKVKTTHFQPSSNKVLQRKHMLDISFFFAGTTFPQLIMSWLRPLFCHGENTHDCKLKQFREMLLTNLIHKQHDVNDVIWRLPVWNVNIRPYLALCTLQFLWNLTNISFQGRPFNYCCALL